MVSTSQQFSLSSTANEWSIDDTAQDLLNEAIASNYRSQHLDEASLSLSDESPKRTASKRKSSKATNDSSLSPATSGEKRGLDKTDAEGRTKSAPKRAGRKPLEKTQPSDAPLDPKQKRKEQNRAAQRAFRERKERHVVELQERIRELEEENASHGQLVEENALLKEQIERLQKENYALKGTPFTFEYPPKTLSHEEEYRSSGNSSSSSCGSLSVGGDKMSGSSNSSVNSSESPALVSETSPETEEEQQQTPPQDFGSSPQQQQEQQQQFNIEDLFFPSSSHDMNFFNPTSAADIASNATVNVLNSSAVDSGAVLSATPITTTTAAPITNTPTAAESTDKNSDLVFTDYRIPPSADSFLFQNDLPPLFGEEFDLFGLSAPAPFVPNSFDPTLTVDQHSLLQQQQQQQQQPINTVQPVQQQPASAEVPLCNLGSLMQTLQQAKYNQPKATDIDRRLKDYCPDFDLDELCSDLKEKVTCSEGVFTPKEMSHIITYMEHKHHEKHPSS